MEKLVAGLLSRWLKGLGFEIPRLQRVLPIPWSWGWNRQLLVCCSLPRADAWSAAWRGILRAFGGDKCPGANRLSWRSGCWIAPVVESVRREVALPPASEH